MPSYKWQKSSFSGEGANCIYIANDPNGSVKIRESDNPEVILTTTPANLHALIQGIKAGEFDHLIEA